MHKYATTISLNDIDAAGIMFFGTYFTKIQEAFEHLIAKEVMPLGSMIKNKEYILPIVNTEANYRIPYYLSDKLIIKVKTDNIGTSSFCLKYQFDKEDEENTFSAKVVHVSVNTKSGKKIDLPEEIKELLKKHR